MFICLRDQLCLLTKACKLVFVSLSLCTPRQLLGLGLGRDGGVLGGRVRLVPDHHRVPVRSGRQLDGEVGRLAEDSRLPRRRRARRLLLLFRGTAERAGALRPGEVFLERIYCASRHRALGTCALVLRQLRQSRYARF